MASVTQCGKYIGQKFGMLTVQKIASKNKYHHYSFECLCDCGNTVIRRVSNLVGGRSKNCGCSPKSGREHGCYKGYKGLSMAHWYRINIAAKERGYSVKIDIEYAWELYEKQGGKCAMTGVPIFLFIPKKDYIKTTASLDRIDNNKDYIEGNVQWVHKKVNQLKNDLTVEDFFELCKNVVKYNNLLEN
jgi:hypothetical protein